MTRPAMERRRTPRAKAEFAIHLAERGEPRAATLKDLSAGGLCCLFPEPLREMTLVEIGMQLPGEAQVQQVRGAVVRCVKVRGVNPPTYEIAIFFTDVPAPCRAAIHEFVTQQITV